MPRIRSGGVIRRPRYAAYTQWQRYTEAALCRVYAVAALYGGRVYAVAALYGGRVMPRIRRGRLIRRPRYAAYTQWPRYTEAALCRVYAVAALYGVAALYEWAHMYWVVALYYAAPRRKLGSFCNPCMVLGYFSPRLLCRFDFPVRAIS